MLPSLSEAAFGLIGFLPVAVQAGKERIHADIGEYDAHEAVIDASVLIAIWNWLAEQLDDKTKKKAA